MHHLHLKLRAEAGQYQPPLLCYILAFLLLMVAPAFLQGQELSRHTFTHYQMGTQFRLILYTESEARADEITELAFAKLDSLNSSLSDYLPDSELNKLCSRAGSGVKVAVSHDLWKVLRTSQEISRKSKGAFDASIGPLSRIWRRAFKQSVFPEEAMVKAAHQKVNHRWIKISRRKAFVKLRREGMQLDLGGIAKGYAADEMAKILRQEGCSQYLIDAGGDLLLGAPPPTRSGWRVATAQANAPPTILSHCAVATSGDRYQYLEWKGKRYSHIIDPRTGYGLIDQQQVTVIAPDATLADALASTLSVLGEGHAAELLKKFPESSATFQEPNN